MRMVCCYECGKRYNYDVDDFCPKCGGFTQPLRTTRIGADGTVLRVDGLSEAGHGESFLHREFHAEEKTRRRSGLDQPVSRQTGPAVRQRPAQRKGVSRQQASGQTLGKIIGWIVLAIVALNFVSMVLGYFLP